jgi:6-phosphogluconolactonase/glucosamine-6-phosphate isomerase/deaminase
MQFIPAESPEPVPLILSKRILQSLSEGKVLWLVCGGSNIPLSVAAMKEIRAAASPETLQNLTIALTDERYGPVDYADSNWKQLIDMGFPIEGIHTIPILVGKSIEETVAVYTASLEEAFSQNPVVIAQFGIGANGHIAGVMPHSVGVTDEHTICAYTAAPYERITLTLPAFKHISVAYAFIFGASKREVVAQLKNEDISLADMPSQILKEIPESYLYSDQPV